jgi:hypothetical protein
MKALLGLLAIVLLGMGVGGCGGSGNGTRSSTDVGSNKGPHASESEDSSVAPTHGYGKNDRDNDTDHNDDDEKVLFFGHAANSAERQTSVALITDYYAAAAAENGAKACSLLASFIAESVVENYGNTAALRGKSCAVVMSKLFKQKHQMLVGESASLKVIRVRVEGDKALAFLYFPEIPEVRQITERRTGETWKILDLLDGILE